MQIMQITHHTSGVRQLLLYTLLLVASVTSAQEKKITINGKVTSFEESLPIEGVSIVVKGTRNETGSQADGTFSLSISPSDKILVISHPGYETQEIAITKSTDYDIILRAVHNFSFSSIRCCEDIYASAAIPLFCLDR